MAVVRDQGTSYRETESVNQVLRTINDSEYSQLKDLENTETSQVRGLEYLDIYDGDEMSESALTARVIAGDEDPYQMTATYHKLSGKEPDVEVLEPVEDIVDDLDVDQLLE